ncbi:hypothetical protein [uncultured Aquimarina sp.]|uniref:hypothetical protein n=1 Tax=uncultured Aquimarina sp. TaxID=575652 RepID=UPI002628D5CE|nr:hypothetical protein [uncultured Aquimarina sp.]
MELYDKIIRIVDANFIFCLFPLILTLILIALVFKNRFKTKQALNLIRWSIVIYTAVSILHFIIGITLFPDEFAFINRATGLYWVIYWLMFFSSTMLPFTLLIRKLATKPWYILFIAVFMKLGVYFERFVIIVTRLHRDYLPDNWNLGFLSFPMFAFIVISLQGFVLAILLLLFFELKERKRTI